MCRNTYKWTHAWHIYKQATQKLRLNEDTSAAKRLASAV